LIDFVTIDRDTRLRQAETLLRQGKLDQAIAAYRHIVDRQPRDWNTANVLGDLYLTAGETDKAVLLFVRVAGSLAQEGFWSKAGAIYKKILKVRPRDEHVLLQAAEMAAKLELLADARAYLETVRDLRRDGGDDPGVSAITIRLAALDPADFDARFAGAGAHLAIGDVASAVKALKQLAAELAELGWSDRAMSALEEAARLAPNDLDLQKSLARFGTGADENVVVEEDPVEPIAQQDAPASDATELKVPVVLEHEKPAPKDLDDVFADLREEATQRFAANDPDQELAAGMAFYQAGQLDFAVPRLEAASRAPAHRFPAAATLGRICLERGDAWRAIDWFERAADAPPPTQADMHRLLYELADALEAEGEVARALAICLELQADAGDYHDVPARIERLTKVQARG